MPGLFGTNASILADLNLLLQILLLVILLSGFMLGKKKTADSLKAHGRVMTLLVALNALSILLIMGPSFFLRLEAVAGEVNVIGFPLTLVHHSLGLIAEILGAVLVFRKFGNVRMWMRVTFTLWLVALVLGITFYISYYVV